MLTHTKKILNRFFCNSILHKTKKSSVYQQTTINILAEREGFEPSVQLPVRRISSAVHSTTLPPLQGVIMCGRRRIRTSEAEATDLQSAPFDRSGILPKLRYLTTLLPLQQSSFPITSAKVELFF